MIVVKRISVLIILIAAFALSLPAQPIRDGVELNWPSSSHNDVTNWFCDYCLSYAGNPDIPIYIKRLSIEKRLHAPAKIINIVAEEVQDFPADLSDFVPSEFTFETSETFRDKKGEVEISVVPLRFNSSTNKIEKLISFDVEYTLVEDLSSNTENTQPRGKNKKKSNSLLSTGDWFKIGVVNDGIYKLTYQDLEQLGLPVNSIDPRHIQLYGYGGGMLPLVNQPENILEMQEIPVLAEGEGDGRFDAGDYLLFFAEGPDTWQFNKNSNRYSHQLHYYADTTYYFITVGAEAGKRIETTPPSSATPEYTTNTYDVLLFHEPEEYTRINEDVKGGKDWYGDEFDVVTQRDYSFNVPQIDAAEPVFVKVNFGARAGSASTYSLSHNGQTIGTSAISSINLVDYTSPYLQEGNIEQTFSPSSGSFSLRLAYQKSTQQARGWLNYIRINARAHLNYQGKQLIFRDKRSIDKITRYNLENSSNVQVWNVSEQHNIRKVTLSGSGNQKYFVAPAGPLQKYAAFTPNAAHTPNLKGRVKNQDLRSIDDVGMVIITHPRFMEQAQRLAEHRRNHSGITITVTTAREIYNEFSAGTPDISAIRNFTKYLYDNAASPETALKYLLLFGDASFDYKDRIKDNTNFVPTFQGIPIFLPKNSVATDDFFGILKDGEGNLHGPQWNTFTVNLGIGRVPATTVAHARDVVDKIIRYENEPDLGDWRNIVSFLSDDEDWNMHIRGNEYLSAILSSDHSVYNQHKIIMDAYAQQTSPSGQSYPNVKKDINNRINAGCLVFNYMGHGGEVGLAHERVVEIPDIDSWKNSTKLPLFVTATCEFSRFDDPKRISAGERVLFNPKGGAIAMLTTTRIAYVGGNERLTQSLFNVLFKPVNGEMPTLGQVYQQTKNNTGLDINSIIFALLGDPSMKIAYPEHNVVTTSINNVDITSFDDTLKALSFVTIKGEVQNSAGEKLQDFNGSIYPTVFDKPGRITTLGQDPNSHKQSYESQENIIYKGKATVENGNFSYSFVVPKDINYRDGFGKISYYAENGSEDGHGYDNVMIGGTSDSAIADDNPPEVALFMNDNTFFFGGLTNENPYLYAEIEDDHGINTTGNGIGHDLTAVLDDGPTIVLNNYYEAEEDNHRKGYIRYPFTGLAEGHHTLRIKVWDIANNSAEAYTEFIVASSAKLALKHLMNYPNPVSDQTKFSVEHNRPNEAISVEISIFDLSGKIIKTIKKDYTSGTTRINDIDWDGKNDNGHTIAKGMYVYKLILRTANGEIASASQKLVLVK